MTEDDKYRGTTSIYPFLTKEASAGLTVFGQTSCAITGAPDIPYFSPEDRRFRQLLQEVTLPAALSPFTNQGFSVQQARRLLLPFITVAECLIAMDSTPFSPICQRPFLKTSASRSSSSAPSKMAVDRWVPPVSRASSSFRPCRSSVSTLVKVRPSFSSFRTE